MPDIFVPADTTANTHTCAELSRQQLFTAYVIDRLQPVLNKYATADDFIKQLHSKR